MAEVIVMPKLSDTMEEGVLANWLKKEGDTVEEGDLLAEIETDKATMEYESPQDGKLLKLIVKPGTKVDLGVAIAVIGEEGESFDESMLDSSGGGSSANKDEAKTQPAKAAEPKSDESSAPERKQENQAQRQEQKAPSSQTGDRVKASPLAKKIAAEKGIDLSSLQGSGPGGRVVMKDVEGASGKEAPAEQPESGVSVSTQGDEARPVTMMRQTIAKRLHAAKNDAPHFYLTRSIDMAGTIAWRKRLNAELESDPSIAKVSVNDIVMLASAKALKKHPECNASWQGDTIKLFGSVHMAMAVALPTGLITPVIKNCDQIGVRDIARQSRELAQKAKQNQLKPEDYSGGTFTVSNLGMLGIEEFTAIINPPQSAILAVGATMATPWVDKNGELTVSQRMKVTMSCDHRVIDGALGAQFLKTLVAFLEDPLMMLS